jgi:hypothetical protein
VSTLLDALRATRPIDGSKTVMVAGDPERKARARHAKEGIAVAPNMKEKIRALAEDVGAPAVAAGGGGGVESSVAEVPGSKDVEVIQRGGARILKWDEIRFDRPRPSLPWRGRRPYTVA